MGCGEQVVEIEFALARLRSSYVGDDFCGELEQLEAEAGGFAGGIVVERVAGDACRSSREVLCRRRDMSSYSPSGQSFAVQMPCTLANSRICCRCRSLSDVSAALQPRQQIRAARRGLRRTCLSSADVERFEQAIASSPIGASAAISATAFGNAYVACHSRQAATSSSGVASSQLVKRLVVAVAEELGDLLLEALQAEGGGEVERVFVEFVELLAEDVVDDIVLQHVGVALVQDAERRVETGFGGVGAEQRRAEGVDRADAGGVDLAEQAEPVLLCVGLRRACRLVVARACGCGSAFRGRRRR